jgi:hypothetical protein
MLAGRHMAAMWPSASCMLVESLCCNHAACMIKSAWSQRLAYITSKAAFHTLRKPQEA